MAFENLLVRSKRTIKSSTVEVQLDGIITERFGNPIRPTQNPIERGAIISDHAIIDPRTYAIEATVTDTPLGAATFGQLIDAGTKLFGDSTGAGLTRSQQAYESLVSLARDREPISVLTGLGTLDNMMILNIAPLRDKFTSRALFFTMDLQEIIIVDTQVSSRNSDDLRGNERMAGASPVNKGRQLKQPLGGRVDESLLVKLINKLGGTL